jgi:hypothetical protein
MMNGKYSEQEIVVFFLFLVTRIEDSIHAALRSSSACIPRMKVLDSSKL